MGRSRFPGKPQKFQNRKRISVLLDTVISENECASITAGSNEEVEGQNEVEVEAPKTANVQEEEEHSPVAASEDSPENRPPNTVKTRSQQKMQVVKSETEKVIPTPKKTVTFGSVESCSDTLKPVKKVPLKTNQPLVSIIKKKSAFKTTEQSAFHSIVKPAKLTDLGSKSCIDFSNLRARHNKSPPVKKSSLKFSQLAGIRSTSPPPSGAALPGLSDKDASKKFVLPTHSAHSSRVIKPNKRFIDTEESATANQSSPAGKVLKKPKLILNAPSDSSNPCYDEAYETCESSANSNDSSDSKHLDSYIGSSLIPSKSLYLDKTLGLFGSASVKSATPSFQDTFVNGLKAIGQIGEKTLGNSENDGTITDSVSESTSKLSKEQLKEGASKRLLQLSRNISETPCTSDQSSSSSTSESSESEASLMTSDSEEDSDDDKERLTIVEKSQTPSQLLSGKVILREARLQLNSGSTNNNGSEGPFSAFGSNSNTSTSNSPGTVTCGVCGAVRFYRFVRQARKFGIYSCESCRKFISKMVKRQNMTQSSSLPHLQCVKGEGNCRVPPILRSQHWKLLRCAYKARCHACWLKMCLKAFQVPPPLKASLQAMLPPYMRPGSPKVPAAVPVTVTPPSNPLRPNIPPAVTAPVFSVLSNTTDNQETEAPPSATKTKTTNTKKATEEEQKVTKGDENPKVEKQKTKENIENDSNSNSSRKRRHARIKVRKKDKPNSRHQPDSTKRQKMELKGPRVKHVCRSASIVLGQPIATFPYSDEKEMSDLSDDNSMAESEKTETESKEEPKVTPPDLCSGCDSSEPMESEELPIDDKDKESIETKNIPKDDESTDSCESSISSENNKENDCVKITTESAKESSESKSSEVEQSVETIQKKPKIALGNITNVRMSSKLLQHKFNQQRQNDIISVDFWESYDPEEVCNTGWGLISPASFSISSVCFLCASQGKEKLVYCACCCEPYHTFCADVGCEGRAESWSEGTGAGWVCGRCERCAGCGGRGAAVAACRACRSRFHASCLAAGRAGQRADWPQICNSCFKCKSCDSSKVTKFLGNLPFCSACFRLRQKGNYCPLCQGCYQDNDFDSKMMECGWCSRWVHAQCEGLSGEGYQLLSALPPSVEYICRQCMPDSPPWRNMLSTYLRGKLIAVLKAMAKNKNACTILKLTPHKTTPNNRKPCVCSSPLAVRKLTFETKHEDISDADSNSATETASNSVEKSFPAIAFRSDVFSTENTSFSFKFLPPISEDRPETAKGTVHKLQESLLQNNEICLSIGSCETKERVTTDGKNEFQQKDDDNNKCNSQSSEDERDSEIDDDSDTCSTSGLSDVTMTDRSMPEISMESDKSQTKDSKGIINAINNTAETSNMDCSDDSSKCLCSNVEPDMSPSFLDIKRKVNSNEYISVKDFNRDMLEAISKTPEIKQVYKDVFTESFPWFNCELNCLNPSLEIDDDNDDVESLKDEDISPFSKKFDGKFSAPSQDQTVPSLESGDGYTYDFIDEDATLHETRVCVLCKVLGEGNPSMEGRLLYCGQGDWIHANCALWSAEVFEEIDGSLQNIQSAISRGRMIKCSKCQNKGASVGCCAKNCSETYHFTCARNIGCAFLDDKRVFCPLHINDVKNKALQKDKDFDLSRPVYVELDRKKKKFCDPQKVQFLLGSLVVKCLGRIIPSVSDFEDVLIPADFVCTRLHWSSKKPWQIVKYTIRTKLLLTEPSPAYDLGVNITLDHSMNPTTVERILAEIGSWHKSLETESHSIMVSKKDKSPIKFGTASVSLEDFAVKQVMEHMLELVSRQDQQDDTPDEEPQNTADLLPPELKEAIFEDLNHDLLDGISMQDIFPKLMSYEDFIAIDLKNEVGDIIKEHKSLNSSEDGKPSDEIPSQDLKVKKSIYLSNNNTEHWLDEKKDLLEDLLNSQSDSGRELKRSKSELFIQGTNLKNFTGNRSHQRSCSLTWSCKFDGTLTSTLKRCKIPRPGLLPRSESNGNVVMVVDGTSDLVVSLATPKVKIDELPSDTKQWQTKAIKMKVDNTVTNISDNELSIDALNTTENGNTIVAITDKIDSIRKPDLPAEKIEKPSDPTEQVIDFYTKIHCSPISQLDGADDYSSDHSECSSPPLSPRNDDDSSFTPISQLDGADDVSSSSSEGGSPPRDQNATVFFRPGDNQIPISIAPSSSNNINSNNELVMRSPIDENVLRLGQAEQTVRCDRCHCTYRTKDSFNRHLPNCDMMSTSESEGETPKSPESRTLTTLQNAFNTSFIQPTFISQQNSVFESSEQFSCPKPGVLSNRRTSVNTRQITINGTIVETQSPGPPSPIGNCLSELSSQSRDLLRPVNIKSPKISMSQGIMPQQQIMVSHVPISPVKNSTINGPKGGIIHTQGNYNICVKPNTGLQAIQPANSITQILPNNGNIQAVLSSNPNQLLTISAPQQNVISNLHNSKNPIMQTFSSMPNSQTITVPINSLQGVPSSIANNLNTFVRPTLSFQNAPTILMPTSCASRMTSPNMQQKNHMILPQMPQKSPKKSPQVQPRPIFQAAKGRGRTLNKTPTIKRQNKLDKPMTNISPNMALGPNNSVIQFQNNGSSNQPSIIVQQVANPNIMSYVEALQQQQQGQNMQYIATIAPQGDFKPATQYISQIPQTFQIQQTESGGLVAVPSGGIPVFLPQGGMGILPQASLQSQGVTISPQGTIQTQNGTAILPQATIQTQNGTATIIPQGTTIQGLTQGNIQTQGLQQHGNMNNSQTTLIPQSALQGQGNTLISQQPGTTILPQGAILPQGLQFCNDQVILGSTPTLEMVTDSSGCMYLTTQPVYYGLETIVQNTVMSSQQFVSTAMQGVLAQNSSFSATTTQVFQASKIEPIVEMPAGYVVVNNVPQENMVSQANVNSQAMIPSQGISTNSISMQPGPGLNQKAIKTVHTPNITIQPASEKVNSNPNNRHTIKTVPIHPNQPIFSLAQPQQIGNTLSLQSIQPRSISVPAGKQNITIQPLQTNILQPGNMQLPINSSQMSQGNFSIANMPIHINQPIVSNAMINGNNSAKVQVSTGSSNQNNTQENNIHDMPVPTSVPQQQLLRPTIPQHVWRTPQSVSTTETAPKNQLSGVSQPSESHMQTVQKIIPSSIISASSSNVNTPSSSNLILSTSVNSSRSYTTQFGQPIFSEAINQSKTHHTSIDIGNGVSSNIPHASVSGFNSSVSQNNTFVSISSSMPQNTPFIISGSMNQQAHVVCNTSSGIKEVETTHNMVNSSGEQIHPSGNNDNNNQGNKPLNVHLQPCGPSRSVPSTTDNNNTSNILHLPNNMMNLTLQGEKIYQMSSNSGNTLNNSSMNNIHNQIGCNIQMHVSNLNRNQNSTNASNIPGQPGLTQLNTSNNHIHMNNSNTNQMHCGNNSIMNSCNQHQFGNNNNGQQSMINAMCGNQSQMMNPNNNQSGNHQNAVSPGHAVNQSNPNVNQSQMINQNALPGSHQHNVTNQSNISANQQLLMNQTNMSGNHQQMINSNNSSVNPQLMMSQNMSANQHQIINQNNMSNMNQQHIINQNSSSSNQQLLMNQNNVSGNQQQLMNMNNLPNNQQQMMNQNNTPVNQQMHSMSSQPVHQIAGNQQQIMGHGNQHQIVNQNTMNSNQNNVSNNQHHIMGPNSQMINSNNHQMLNSSNQPSTPSSQLLGNNIGNHLSNNNQISSHCNPLNQMQMASNAPNSNMQLYNNQLHISNTTNNSNNHMNLCNSARPHIAGGNNLHSAMDPCNQNEINNGVNHMQILNNPNERSQMQITNINPPNQIPISNNLIGNQLPMNNQMHMNNNQMQMVNNQIQINKNQTVVENVHCDMSVGSNNNSQYHLPNQMNDQIFMMNNSSNVQENPGNGTVQHSSNNVYNSSVNQMQVNQNQLPQNALIHQNQHVHSTPAGSKTGNNNQDLYNSKNITLETSGNTMSIMPTENLTQKMTPVNQNATNKQMNQHVLSISANNQMGFIQMSSNNNQIMNFERNQVPHMSNTANSQMSNMNQISQNRPMISLGQSDMMSQSIKMDSSDMQPGLSNDPQSSSVPIINISNGSLTIPPLSHLMNKHIALPQHIANSCMNQSTNNVSNNQNNLLGQINHAQNNMNIQLQNSNSISLPSQSSNNTINLPTQSSSSINLPKAPPHQSGIPTNVVNPIPQSMRPMNRVLPIHRDAQSAKATPKPKPKVEPPKPTPRSQDMPDLNPKEEEVVINSDLNKAISESKALMELEERKKSELLRTQAPPVSSTETPLIATVRTDNIKPGDSENVNTSFKILIQKKSPSGNVYKISTKNIKEKENVDSEMVKTSQKFEFSKMTNAKLQNLPTVGRKVNIRGKAGLENRSIIKSTKQSPGGARIPKDDGPKMIYEISSEDGFSYSSTSLADLWSKVLEAVQSARKQHGLSPLQYNLPQSTTKMAEAQILGLHNNALKYLIEQLPGASRCTKYRAKHGCKVQSVWEPETESLRESVWGCARAGPAPRRPCADTFSWLASPHRDPPPPLIDSDTLVSRRLTSTTLPMAMRFRHLKETSKQAVGVYRSHIHGRGLFCRRDIEAGEMVIEYAGEVIRAALADQRERKYEAARGGRGVNGCYMFRVDDHLVVDATMKGNAARFINHSCDPNCYSRVVDILGHKHIVIFALRRISQGEELTYDYKFPFEEIKIPCTCGAKKCRKYLN